MVGWIWPIISCFSGLNVQGTAVDHFMTPPVEQLVYTSASPSLIPPQLLLLLCLGRFWVFCPVQRPMRGQHKSHLFTRRVIIYQARLGEGHLLLILLDMTEQFLKKPKVWDSAQLLTTSEEYTWLFFRFKRRKSFFLVRL